MHLNRLLLCTDMDRTVIPNGSPVEHPDARPCFREFCRLPEVQLVYVTGRHRALVQQAITDYVLPEPDFAVTDVGTKIYSITAGAWAELEIWEETIAGDWQGKSHAQIQHLLQRIPGLILQEEAKQNTYKLSYYLPLNADKEWVLRRIENRLKEQGVAASLIWSIDEPAQVGLLDVLPRNATKLHGIQFLQRYLGYRPDEVLFAGDSGNDLPVFGSAVASVVVANASDEIKHLAQQLAREHGQMETLYLAEDTNFRLGGNYAAGVLQGAWHFFPALRHKLQPAEFRHE